MPPPRLGHTLRATMCFGAFTHTEQCELCGRHHPDGFGERCIELRSEAEAERLEAELRAYLDSTEARFFTWLAGTARRGGGASCS